MIEVFRPQTKRAMIAVFRSYGSIGNDGAASQTSERCLTRTKSFLGELVNIHMYYTTTVFLQREILFMSRHAPFLTGDNFPPK